MAADIGATKVNSWSFANSLLDLQHEGIPQALPVKRLILWRFHILCLPRGGAIPKDESCIVPLLIGPVSMTKKQTCPDCVHWLEASKNNGPAMALLVAARGWIVLGLGHVPSCPRPEITQAGLCNRGG
ncbi:MAG: hypothetical protein ACNA7Q_14325, partial [Rhodobacterales bacterium]